jgi:environmental stress-induced protein Ves
MPWKNGLGTTTEIAVYPEGAPLDAFAWRVSIADVGGSGPFSRFPGADRVIVQIDGAPMTLLHEGIGEQRLARLVPHRFAGEVATHAQVNGPARDFNVMVRRDQASARVSVHELGVDAHVTVALGEADACLAHVLEGAVSAELDDRRAGACANETLVARGRAALVLGAAGGAVILLAEIRPSGRF